MAFAQFIDESTNLEFYERQLENIDTTLNQPLENYTWSRDISLRPNVVLSDEVTTFRRADYAGTGTTSLTGIPWVTAETTALPGITLSREQVSAPMRLAGAEVSYSVLEIEKAQRLGVNLDTEKTAAIQTRYQFSIDRMVYLGDPGLDSDTYKSRGLMNNDTFNESEEIDFASGGNEADPDVVITGINNLLTMLWEKAGGVVVPNKLLVPTGLYAYLVRTKYSSNAEITAMAYLKDHNICAERGVQLEIDPTFYANTAGANQKGRIVAYNKDTKYIRQVVAPIRRFSTETGSFTVRTPYIWGLGGQEIVYPETVGYADLKDSKAMLAMKATSRAKTAAASETER